MHGKHIYPLPADIWARCILIPRNVSKRIAVWLTLSLLVHSALVVTIVSWPASHTFLPALIPISVVTIDAAASHEQPELFRVVLGIEVGSVSSTTNSTSSLLQADSGQTFAAGKLGETANAGNESNPSGIPARQDSRLDSEESISAGSSPSTEIPTGYLWNTTETAAGLGEAPELTVTRRTDWQANLVDDYKLTYSAPDAALKLSMREASSAGFAGRAFSGFATSNDFAPEQWGTDATARSQRLDWTVLKATNFQLTAFGYQSEVGRNFVPFGQTKNEFAMAGTKTIKAGGQVRAGAFGLGFAESSLLSAGPVTNLPAVQQGATSFAAEQQDASVTLDLPYLMEGTQISKFLPTLWVTGSQRHGPAEGQELVPRQALTSSFGAPTIWVTGTGIPRDIITSSFGGTWEWDSGYANLNYWSYSANGSESFAGTGRGFNASFGVYRSSFGMDVDLSYGHSEDVAQSSQSTGVMYDSSVTVSYKPDRRPGVWASASVGNYNQNAIDYGGTASDLYAVSTNGEYWSITAGLDLTSLFWEISESGALNGQRPSVKLLSRFSDSLDSSDAGTTRNDDALVAMIIRQNF